jgi:hypothetical protein
MGVWRLFKVSLVILALAGLAFPYLLSVALAQG